MSFFESIILALVEGITEFLPISSTGHIIIFSSLLGISSSAFVKTFTVAVQLGAILAVVVLYWEKFWKSLKFYFVLCVAVLPILIIGFMLKDKIDALLDRIDVVGYMLILGGIVLIFLEDIIPKSNRNNTEVSYFEGMKIGFFQCLALLPGVSRSAATIIGGMAQGLKKRDATEFSFFLAVPTMVIATAYKVLNFFLEGHGISEDEITILVVGNIVAFFVAILAIKTFIRFISNNSFKIFGYYRIIIGIIILTLFYFGKIQFS